jgi:hypothetical protein
MLTSYVDWGLFWSHVRRWLFHLNFNKQNRTGYGNLLPTWNSVHGICISVLSTPLKGAEKLIRSLGVSQSIPDAFHNIYSGIDNRTSQQTPRGNETHLQVLFGPILFGRHTCHIHANMAINLPENDAQPVGETGLTTSDFNYAHTVRVKPTKQDTVSYAHLNIKEELRYRFSKSRSAQDDHIPECVICLQG